MHRPVDEHTRNSRRVCSLVCARTRAASSEQGGSDERAAASAAAPRAGGRAGGRAAAAAAAAAAAHHLTHGADAARVVDDALLLVTQDLVCLGDLTELLLRLRVPLVLVGVVLHRQLAVCLLDLAVARLGLQAYPLIQVDLRVRGESGSVRMG